MVLLNIYILNIYTKHILKMIESIHNTLRIIIDAHH